MPRRQPQLKVFGGWCIHSMPKPYRNQVRAICAAPSAAAVRRIAEAVGYKLTYSHMRDFWTETGNALDVAVATASPELLLYQPMDVRQRSGGLGGVWLPWTWPWPAIPPTTGPGMEINCTSCGTDIDTCDEMVFAKGSGCCPTCRLTDTHNDPINAPARTARLAAAKARVEARSNA